MNDLIVQVSKGYRTVIPAKTFIGNDGENLQTKLIFTFLDEFIDGVGRLEVLIDDEKSYIPLVKENESYYLPIKNVMTKVGNIELQLVITEAENEFGIPLYKSDIFKLYCKDSINAVEEAPEGYDLWIDIANAKIIEIDEKIEEVNQAIIETNNLNITLSKSEGITTVTLTKKDGSKEIVRVYDGETGNGIESITKTGTTGLVDTYTITYTDGTTTTFEVTNGEVSQAQLDETNAEVERAMMVYNALPKVEDEDTNITLDGTANCPMKLKLNPSELTQETEPTPDNPSEVQVIKGNNSIKIWNRNFFDKNNLSQYGFTGTVEDEGAIIYNTVNNYTNSIQISGFKENTQYTFSYEGKKSGTNALVAFVKVYYTDGTSSDARLNDLTTTYQTKTFTTSENKSIDYILFWNGTNGSTYSWKLNLATLIITEGTELGEYVAHQEQVLPLNLPSGMEYCKIGTYEDEFEHDGDKWYLNKYIGKVVLDGSENWTTINAYSYSILKSSLSNFGVSEGDTINWINTHFQKVNSLSNIAIGKALVGGSYLNFDYDKNVGGVANFKTWLSNNNVTVYYVLATPTHTEITDTTLISQLNAIEQALSYDEQTNISQTNTGLPFKIKASAVRSLVNIFDIISGGA